MWCRDIPSHHTMINLVNHGILHDRRVQQGIDFQFYKLRKISDAFRSNTNLLRANLSMDSVHRKCDASQVRFYDLDLGTPKAFFSGHIAGTVMRDYYCPLFLSTWPPKNGIFPTVCQK
jgi:hypothetical protein